MSINDARLGLTAVTPVSTYSLEIADEPLLSVAGSRARKG